MSAMLTLSSVASDLHLWFQEEYRALRPRAPMPPIEVRFRRFTGLNTTIRLRQGRLYVSLSDLLEGAEESVLRAIAHILLAKLYRKPVNPAANTRYRRFTTSKSVSEQTERIRQTRGRKRMVGSIGKVHNLEEIFESLNRRYFNGLLGQPNLTWSTQHARRLLGHYDAAHNTIVVSRIFDRLGTPLFAIEYLLYHEMLHLKYPVTVRGGRRCVHSREFHADERRFAELDLAKAWLKRIP